MIKEQTNLNAVYAVAVVTPAIYFINALFLLKLECTFIDEFLI